MATNTPTLGLETDDFATYPPAYWTREQRDRVDNANSARNDAFAANVTASFTTTFAFSGTMSTLLTTVLSDYAPTNRVITQVVAWHAVTGSSGVTLLDVQRQEDGVAGAFVSIFANQVFKPFVSASLPTFTPYIARTISGSLWKAGTILKVIPNSAAVAMGDVTVAVQWKPSGSYGA